MFCCCLAVAADDLLFAVWCSAIDAVQLRVLAVQIVTTFPVFVVVLCCLLYSSKVILCDSRWMMKQRATKRCVFAGGLLAVALRLQPGRACPLSHLPRAIWDSTRLVPPPFEDGT